MVDRILNAAKAIVAALLPIISLAASEWLAEFQGWQDGLLAALVTAIGVWATPNRELV